MTAGVNGATGDSGKARSREPRQEGSRPGQRSQVVVIGGGFGGLYAVRALRRGPCDITLVDRSEHHLFQPLLYQCATGILSEGQITAPLRQLSAKDANVECVMAKVVDLDPGQRSVTASGRSGNRSSRATTTSSWRPGSSSRTSGTMSSRPGHQA